MKLVPHGQMISCCVGFELSWSTKDMIKDVRNFLLSDQVNLFLQLLLKVAPLDKGQQTDVEPNGPKLHQISNEVTYL